MKKVILILLILMLTLTPALAAIGGVEAAGSFLEAKLLKYEPVPSHPGDTIDVWIKLDNSGGDLAQKVNLEFLDNYPFSLESDSRRVHNIGALSGGYDYVAKFKVRVDKNAPIGSAFVKVRYSEGSSRLTETFLELDVESRITTLSLDFVRTEPSKLEPGGIGTITVKITNNANSKVRRVSAKLDLENSDAPVVPMDSATELKIDELPGGESHEFIFRVIAKLNAEANAYSIPLNLTFTDDEGKKKTYRDLIGIVISSEPDLVLTIDSTDIYSDEPSGKVIFKFINKGVDEIKFVYFKLLPSDNYELLSPTDEYYVGNVDSDDYEVEEVMLKSNVQDKLEIPMLLEYRDSANKLYEVQKTVTINLVSKEDINGKKSNTKIIVIVAIILAIIVIYVWRRRKRVKH